MRSGDRRAPNANVFGIPLQEGARHVDPVRLRNGVVVCEEDEVASRPMNSGIAGCRRASAHPSNENRGLCFLLPQRWQAAVIDDDHLVRTLSVLKPQRIETARQLLASIPRRDDDGRVQIFPLRPAPVSTSEARPSVHAGGFAPARYLARLRH